MKEEFSLFVLALVSDHKSSFRRMLDWFDVSVAKRIEVDYIAKLNCTRILHLMGHSKETTFLRKNDKGLVESLVVEMTCLCLIIFSLFFPSANHKCAHHLQYNSKQN